MLGCALKGRHVRRRAFIEFRRWSILERWKVAGRHLCGWEGWEVHLTAPFGFALGSLHGGPNLLGRETDFLGDFLDVEVVFEPASNRRDRWTEPFEGIELCLDAEASALFELGERSLYDPSALSKVASSARRP